VPVRLTALASIPGGLNRADPAIFSLLTAQLEPDRAAGDRSAAAQVLSRAKLTPDQLLALTHYLKTVGPLELDRVVEAFGQSAEEQVGLRLIAALKESPAFVSLRADALKQRLAKYTERVREQAEELYAALAVDEAKQKEHLQKLLATLQPGDVRRGQAV